MPVTLDLPGVLNPTTGPGPTYATKVNAALTTLAAATHTGGANGDKWTAASLNIDGNVSWSGFSITQVKLTSYTPQSTVSTANSLWFKSGGSGDLWATNGSGTPIQITSGGSLNVAGLIASIWPQLLVSTSIAISASDTYSHFKIDTSAARTITLPSAAAVGAGRFYIFTDHTGGAATNNITISADGSDTIFGVASYAISSAYGSATFVSDGVSAWSLAGGSLATQVLNDRLSALTDLTVKPVSRSAAGSGFVVNIEGGANSGAGTDGGVRLKVDTSTMIEATEVAVGRRVVSLALGTPISTGEMPANTGDGVVFLADAATPPASANPTGGVILYATGGQFGWKTADGNRFITKGETSGSATGGAATLPANPIGFLVATISSGATVKFPYYG